LDLLAGISCPTAGLNVIEELGDRSGFWPAGLMAMKASVRIIETDDLAEGFATLLLEHDGSSHLATETAHAQNDSAWDSVRIVERDADDAFVAAPGPRFIVEVVHEAPPSKLRRRVVESGTVSCVAQRLC